MNSIDIDQIEKGIDSWLFDLLDSSLPRNSYIYHCNLAYIDFVIENKILFSLFEKHFLFSLSYNTYLAHLKLDEELTFTPKFDKGIYDIAFKMLLRGMNYSMLCDIFPLLHSGLATMQITGNNISFNIAEIPKKNYKYINDYAIRKALSYTLQIGNGKLQDKDENTIALELSNLYMCFWSENMQNADYEPYSSQDWNGINFFFVVAAMRRFNKLYKNDFDICKLDSQKAMIVLSPEGVSKIKDYVPYTDEKMYGLALEEHIYKPIGINRFPKISISDAPLNKTKDGYIFANPLVILFNESPETRYLNYLRRCDNQRYLRIKDKIKERVIPLIVEMIAYRFSDVIAVQNFYVKIPLQKKNRRECDLLLVNQAGVALYLEIKHFYYPQSFCEIKRVDNELSRALDKMPDQLMAIKENWEILKQIYHIPCDLIKINGIIVSHHYTGYNVKIDHQVPIISFTELYENIVQAQSFDNLYDTCKEVDNIYPTINFLKRGVNFPFANWNFYVELESLDPFFETLFIKAFRKKIYKQVSLDKTTSYNSIADLAHAYIDALEKSINKS